jgi:cytochrome c553
MFLVLALSLVGMTAARAESPVQAYLAGCAGCHDSERAVLRKIPRLPDAQRAVWIDSFMASHPCEADRLKPLIRDYLMQKTAR